MPAGTRNNVLLLFLGFTVLSLFTLDLFPLPWFDEAYLNSVSVSFLKHQNFLPFVSETARNGKEALSYGPVYFVLQSGLIGLFGNSPFVFRLVGFIAALSILLLVYYFGREKKYVVWLVALLALDPFFNLCLREGRPDILAACFALSGWWFFLKEKRNDLVGALFLTLAFLTHPRAVVLIAPLFLFFILNKNFKSFGLSLLIVAVAYSAWLFYAFGSLENWYLYFSKAIEGNETARSGFLGPNTYWPKVLIPVYTITLISVVYNTLKYPSVLAENILFTLPILLFHVFLRDFGTYSILILPFIYILLSKNINSFSIKLQKAAFSVLIALFSFFFILKIGLYASIQQENDLESISTFVEEHIPEGSKVIGDALFYYALPDEKYTFQLYDKYLEDSVRIEALEEDFQYEYLILPADQQNAALLQLYKKSARLVPVSGLHYPTSVVTKEIASLHLISTKDINGYNCILFKRLVNE